MTSSPRRSGLVSRTGRRPATGRGLVLALMLGGILLPLVPLVVWSVSGAWRYPELLPQRSSARGFLLLSDPRSEIPQALVTSTLIAMVVSLLAGLIGLPAGRAIGAYRFRGRRAVSFLLLAPVIVPGLAVSLGLQVFFIRVGLADTVAGVVLVHLLPTVPYVATVLGGAFANLEVGFEQQARTLGAGPVRVAVFVTLPLLRPALVIALLFAFLISWSEYVLTLLVGGGQVTTLPLLLFAAIGSSDTTAAGALALLMIVPPLSLLVLSSRVLSGGSAAAVGFPRL